MKADKTSFAQKSLSRKNFIKNAAIATAGFYIVPRNVLGGKGYVPPSDKLYIAAVGCGGCCGATFPNVNPHDPQNLASGKSGA